MADQTISKSGFQHILATLTMIATLLLMIAVATATALFIVQPNSAWAEETSTDMDMQSRHFGKRMDDVDRNLNEMRRMMDRIHKTEEPDKRRSMMHSHWQTMHETMQMMHGDDSGQGPACGSLGHHMMGMHGGGMGMSNEDMAINQRMMGRCLDAQNRMMQQMMEHEHQRRHYQKQ